MLSMFIHGLINSYHSFRWGILCLYNVESMNICMKEFGLKNIFDKMTAERI